MNNPVLDEVTDDDKLTCPACREGRITAYFQATVEIPPGGPMRVITNPDSDDFINAGCSNLDCDVELQQEPGDGRLRRAHIEDISTVEPIEDDAMLAAYTEAVEILLRRHA